MSFHPRPGMLTVKAVSHCPEIDSRWTPKYEILKFLVLVYLGCFCFFIYLCFIYIYKYIWESISSQLQDSVTPASTTARSCLLEQNTL